VNALFAESVDVAFESRGRILAKEALQNTQVALVVDFGARLEGLERLDDLDGQPVTLVLYFADNHLVEAL
jgi:hypothetical protein